MPLPPALLARLQRRGIVKADEEVIAESYDADTGEQKERNEENDGGAPGCPNKNNPYHLCGSFCYSRWGEGMPEYRLPESYNRRRQRMLSLYPLPEGWTEVYDAGMARHYYWNQNTDEVCWLSPRHPRAVIGEAAPQVAKEMFSKREGANWELGGVGARDDGYNSDEERRRRRERDRRDYDRDSYDRRDKDRGDRDRFDDRRRRRRDDSDSDEDRIRDMSDRDRLKRANRKGIDPMDPAAYGDDVPVGGWSVGINRDEKTGADVTASGPLFQQRPYPAPGAVLRKNQGH